MYLDNKYTKWYLSITAAAKDRKKCLGIYTETHHIVPKSFYLKRTGKGTPGWLPGDPENPNNKVVLTGREHVICHLLLVKMTTGLAKKKSVYALWGMTRANSESGRIKLTSRQYAFAREEFAKVMSELHKGKPTRKKTDAEKAAQSEKTKGIPRTDKTKENMKKAWVTRDRTVKKSTIEKLSISITEYWASEGARDAQRQKRIKYLKNNPNVVDTMVSNINKIMECKHCGIETNIGNHNRWHGNNCKLNTSGTAK